MEKIILIIGKVNSGKSTVAKGLTAGLSEEEKIFLPSFKLNNPFAFSECTELTKAIIIDDLKADVALDGFIYQAFHGVEVNKKMKAPFIIKPKIIIVLREEITKEQILQFGSSIVRRFEIIETLK